MVRAAICTAYLDASAGAAVARTDRQADGAAAGFPAVVGTGEAADGSGGVRGGAGARRARDRQPSGGGETPDFDGKTLRVSGRFSMMTRKSMSAVS